MLSLQLLGAFEVAQDGDAVRLPQSRKSRALLAYLALVATACRRDDLCGMFWTVPDDPRGALRWSLSKLRPIINTDKTAPLIADRLSVQFDTSSVEIDLDLVRTTASDDRANLDALERAWELADKGLLLDCDLPSLPRFTEWLVKEREALECLKVGIAKRLAGHAQLSKSQRAIWLERSALNDEETMPAPSSVASSSLSQPGDYPADQQVQFVRSHDGVNIAWAEVGDSRQPTIIKAANWLTHLELDWQAPIWSPLFHDLAKDHHLVRYDERGCGLSDWDVPQISFDTFVTDLEQVVEATGVEKFVLLGISQGAAVSIEYAARYPERVSKLVLFGGYPVGWRPIATPEEEREREAVMVLTGSGWGRPDPSYRRLFSQTFMPDATLAELDWFDDFQRRTTSPENAVRFLEAFSTIDVRSRLGDVKVPTLVLHSRGDRRIPHSTGRDMTAQIDGARLITLESNNHLLIGRESAADAFVSAVRDFVRED